MEIRKLTSVIIIFTICLCGVLLKSQTVEAKLATPESPVAICKNNHSIK